jgi:hypothetical protein
MESGQQNYSRKGGRPKKIIKRDQQLAVMCTVVERFVIVSKAEKLQISLSQFLREMGLKGQVNLNRKSIPKEILLLSGTLNHVAANLNQIAKKRNQGEELNALERAQLQSLRTELSTIAVTLKEHYK